MTFRTGCSEGYAAFIGLLFERLPVNATTADKSRNGNGKGGVRGQGCVAEELERRRLAITLSCAWDVLRTRPFRRNGQSHSRMLAGSTPSRYSSAVPRR